VLDLELDRAAVTGCFHHFAQPSSSAPEDRRRPGTSCSGPMVRSACVASRCTGSCEP
jgi:hypothetical protein